MMPRVSATLAFVEDTGRSDEEKKKAVVALAGCSVHAAQVLAVLEIARNGFHRADVVNLQWSELGLTFTGLRDLPDRAKRRSGVSNPALATQHVHPVLPGVGGCAGWVGCGRRSRSLDTHRCALL